MLLLSAISTASMFWFAIIASADRIFINKNKAHETSFCQVK